MLRQWLLAGAFGCLLAGSSMAADVFVRVAPPRPVIETRTVSPGRGYYWTPGYHRWDGRAYAWSPGQWVMPPRPRARWVPAHWAHRRGGYVFVEGHWR